MEGCQVPKVPFVTLATVVGQVALYLGVAKPSWTTEDVCISIKTVVDQSEYRRLFLSVLQHTDNLHLYYTMLSFLNKGSTLEMKYGSKNFGIIVMFLLLLQSALYLLVGQTLAYFMDTPEFLSACSIGFSGVVFAVKVLKMYEHPRNEFSLPILGVYATWLELVLINLLAPNSSHITHGAGVLAGLLYAYTYVGSLVDIVVTALTGEPVPHGDDEGEGAGDVGDIMEQGEGRRRHYRHKPNCRYYRGN